MATVHDIAAYILRKRGPTSAMTLQKLLYYSQAWSLVWDERPLFRSRIEAWANGPVIRSVYEKHRGEYRLSRWTWGDSRALTKDERETVDAVLNLYGRYTAQELSDLTHAEDPWKEARRGLNDGQRGDSEITHASMMEYYSGLQRDGQA